MKHHTDAYDMYKLRESNKNPADQAVNLPLDGVDRVRWTINTLKECMQPDGTFVGLAGVQTEEKASPKPTVSLYQSRFSSVLDAAPAPVTGNCRQWKPLDRKLYAFAVVSAFLSPVSALVAGVSIATLSGASVVSAGAFFGAMIGLVQAIPVVGQVYMPDQGRPSKF